MNSIKRHSTFTLKMITTYTLFSSLLLAATGCIQTDPDNPLCMGGEFRINDQPCGAGYTLASPDECDQNNCITQEDIDSCGNPIEILCRETEDCPAIAIPSAQEACEREGLQPGTDELCRYEDCQTLTIDLGCGCLLYTSPSPRD